MTSSPDRLLRTHPVQGQVHRLSGVGSSWQVRSSLPLSTLERVVMQAPPPPPIDVVALVRCAEHGLQELQASMSAVFGEIEREFVALVCDSVERIVGRAPSLEQIDLHQPLQELMQRAARQYSGMPLCLRVHSTIAAELRRGIEATATPSPIQVIEDDQVPAGDLMLECGAGRLLRSFAEQMAVLRESLGAAEARSG